MLYPNIATAREKSYPTMRAAAEALGLQYTTYVSYEKGERDPSPETLIRFAEIFGVTVDFMLGREA